MPEAIKGLDQLIKNMASLPDKLKGDAFVAGTRNAANVFAKAAKARCPYGKGIDTASQNRIKTKKKRIHLRDTIKTTRRYAKAGHIEYIVHAGKGLRYGHLVEFGSAPHTITSKHSGLYFSGRVIMSVRHRGSRAKPFMRPAFDNSTTQAIAKFGVATQKRIDKLRFKV
jgi:HK97 gp10 family phage protein